MKNNTTFFKLVQKNDDQKGHNRVRKLPFMRERGTGGAAWFSTISGQIGWYSAEPTKHGGEEGNHYIADQDKMV
jgi:hypothetical protein